MDLRRHTKYFGKIWLLIGVLFSICVFVGIPKRDKYLAFYSCYKYKKTNTQIKNGHFVMCIHVSVQRNHLFCKTNTQKTVVKVNNLRTEEKPSFVYLRIRVSGQRNHSLRVRVFGVWSTLRSFSTIPFCFLEWMVVVMNAYPTSFWKFYWPIVPREVISSYRQQKLKLFSSIVVPSVLFLQFLSVFWNGW